MPKKNNLTRFPIRKAIQPYEGSFRTILTDTVPSGDVSILSLTQGLVTGRALRLDAVEFEIVPKSSNVGTGITTDAAFQFGIHLPAGGGTYTPMIFPLVLGSVARTKIVMKTSDLCPEQRGVWNLADAHAVIQLSSQGLVAGESMFVQMRVLWGVYPPPLTP
jgi:hypothetical protein